MPLLGGAALAVTLRRFQPALPIFAMSGLDSHTSATHKDFAAAFLAKLFHAETLLSLVRRTLDASPHPLITAREIARRLGIATEPVGKYRFHIFRKRDLRTTAELVRYSTD